MKKINIHENDSHTNIIAQSVDNTQANPLIVEKTETRALPTYKYAVNKSGKDKNWDFSLLTTDYQDVEGTIENIKKDVKQGFAINGAQFNGKRRCKANVTGINLLLLDIDNSMVVKDANGKTVKEYSAELTLEDAKSHPFIKEYGALIYTTASHKLDWHKFRIVLPLPESVDVPTYEALIEIVATQFPYDEACKDGGRVFFGNSKAEIHLFNPYAVLPKEFIKEAKIKVAENKTQNKTKTNSKKSDRKKNNGTFNYQDSAFNRVTVEIVRNALRHIEERIEGGDNYHRCLPVITALVNEFGEDVAYDLASEWSPNWTNLEKKITQTDNPEITIEYVYGRARANGWVHPDDRIEDSLNASDFINRLKAKSLKLSKSFAKGFGQYVKHPVLATIPKTINYDPQVGLPNKNELDGSELPKIIFKKGDRLKCITECEKKGYQFILDSSLMGLGKTHEVTLIEPDKGSKIWYLSDGHRNPNVKHIAKIYNDLIPRHQGMDYSQNNHRLENEAVVGLQKSIFRELPRSKYRKSYKDIKLDRHLIGITVKKSESFLLFPPYQEQLCTHR